MTSSAQKPPVAGPREIDGGLQETSGLYDKVSKLETELFEAREIISGVKALDRVTGLIEKVRIFNSLLRERLKSDRSVFLLYTAGEEVFRLAESTGISENLNPELTIPRTSGLFWELACQGEVFSLHAPGGTMRFGNLFADAGLDAAGLELFVPLVIGGVPVGLAAFAVEDAGAWLEDVYLPRFASQAAPSLKNAMLYEVNQKDKEALDRTLNSLKMLYNVGRMMNNISELKELLKFILNEAIRTTEAQKGSLMLLDEITHRLMVRVVQGLPDQLVEKKINDGEIQCASFASGEGIAGKVFAEKKPMIVNNVGEVEDFSKRDTSNVQSIICVPLIVNDETIGVINITNKKDGKNFTDEDSQMLAAMGGQAAMGIHRAQLYNLAIKDELTGLYIRRYFQHRLQEEIRRARRYGVELSIIMLDIDHFKNINDTYGHAAGDKALVSLSKVISDSLRGSDIPCRYGGEEFILMLPETPTAGAALLAERLRAKVEQTMIPSLNRAITVSLGVATFPKHADEGATLIHAADMALYSAKGEGRNRVVVWDVEGGPRKETETEEEVINDK